MVKIADAPDNGLIALFGGKVLMSTLTDLSILPDLASDYPLTGEQTSRFQCDGHILLRGLASPGEAAAYRAAIGDAVARFNTETRSLEARDTYGRAFLQVMNLWRRDEAVRRFTLARRFAKVAAELLGVRGVRLYHDQALYKEAGGGHTPWHQDQHYWPLATDKTVTLWMPLVDADTTMGTMQFASGSHREGYLGDLPISDRSDDALKEFIEDKGYPVVRAGAMKAGDATFHTGWALHGAPGNNSAATREVMTIIYFADGTQVGSTDNPSRESDLREWLPGLQPGDLAASELNPLLYSQ